MYKVLHNNNQGDFQRRELNDCLFLYKHIHSKYNLTTANPFSFHVPERRTRSASKHIMHVPMSRVDVTKKGFVSRVSSSYNQLHESCDVFGAKTLNCFRRQLIKFAKLYFLFFIFLNCEHLMCSCWSVVTSSNCFVNLSVFIVFVCSLGCLLVCLCLSCCWCLCCFYFCLFVCLFVCLLVCFCLFVCLFVCLLYLLGFRVLFCLCILTSCVCFNVRCVFVYLLVFPGLFDVGFGVLFLSTYNNVFINV